ncbi:thiamine pyrophosphate-dependent enzyme [Bacillus sp. FJAT-27245]|uniref:thiamine pyrophosphate-dependent enzyme n=1 Tax=Bacillus sp. FJAT-27245 TaxID=1684144 RepID=UPI0006A77BD5|nr:thiamine pyrophosphate-dependent enzyme [Bacillus sp. FJAT-27245]
MAVARKVPELVDRPMGFCPGCGHGIVIRLITECLEELGQDKNVIFGLGVGCSSLLGGGLDADRLHCSHGRASAVCTAMKRVNPDNMVIAYQGDGDAYSIGLAETTSAAYRNENFTAIIINNTNYGMTGGQMSNTTMPGQRTATTPAGRDCSVTGMPIKFPELVASQFNPAYVARGSVHTPVQINKLKSYIKNALKAQMNGEGYSVVEVLSPCPTNWGQSAQESMARIVEELVPYFPLGELKAREAK